MSIAKLTVPSRITQIVINLQNVIVHVPNPEVAEEGATCPKCAISIKRRSYYLWMDSLWIHLKSMTELYAVVLGGRRGAIPSELPLDRLGAVRSVR